MSLPPPEVFARPARLEEMPANAKLVGRLAREAGYRLRVTYARGPRTLDLQTSGWIADSIRVTARRGIRVGIGHWMHDKDGVYGFDFGYVVELEPWIDKAGIQHQIPVFQRCNFPTLKAYLKQ